MSEMYMDIIKLRRQIGEMKRKDENNSGSCQHADDCFWHIGFVENQNIIFCDFL